MCRTHHFTPVDGQTGRHNSAAHESLRAMGRCLLVNLGEPEGRRRLESAVYALFGVNTISKLSESQAYEARKFVEKWLPDSLS